MVNKNNYRFISPLTVIKNNPENNPNNKKKNPGNSHYLIPLASRLLGFTARYTWKMIKGLALIALRIPGWFVRLNKPKVTVKARSGVQKYTFPKNQ